MVRLFNKILCSSALPWFMLFHFLVDFCCGASVVGIGINRIQWEQIAIYVALYNILAFCTQPLTGWICDRQKNDRMFLAVSLALVFAGGATVSFSPWLAVVLLGMGNSLFHVSAGREVVRSSQNGSHRIGPLGAFVGPGALGIGLGCLLAQETYGIALTGLGVCGLAGLLVLRKIPSVPEMKEEPEPEKAPDNVFGDLCMGLIVFCVFCRAATGCIKAPWTGNHLLSILLFCIVVAGKIGGGYIAERFGWKRVGILSLILAWGLVYFCGGTVWGFMTGQFAANLMMAITLFLLAALHPRLPGTMFGVAAAVLYPGSLFRYLPGAPDVFTVSSLIAVICFLLTSVLWNKAKTDVV